MSWFLLLLKIKSGIAEERQISSSNENIIAVIGFDYMPAHRECIECVSTIEKSIMLVNGPKHTTDNLTNLLCIAYTQTHNVISM